VKGLIGGGRNGCGADDDPEREGLVETFDELVTEAAVDESSPKIESRTSSGKSLKSSKSAETDIDADSGFDGGGEGDLKLLENARLVATVWFGNAAFAVGRWTDTLWTWDAGGADVVEDDAASWVELDMDCGG
jgi:hypothetical protein